MGFLWEAYQHNRARHRDHEQEAATDDLETRVARLEDRVAEQDGLMGELIQRLEATLGQDLDGDGRGA